MKKIRAAIVGYGNIGKYVYDAIMSSEDFELAGIVRRKAKSEMPKELENTKITDNIQDLGKVDVVILSTPSRTISREATKYLSMGINTVDSYDIHSTIFELKQELDVVAKKHGVVSIISAGWDPGSDSVVRTLMEAMAPKGITYTNFGPGMSMGHTVAVKAIDGVKAALSMTIPKGTGVHRRMVYIEIESGADFKSVESAIKNDAYFIHDETYVILVDDVNDIIDMGHGVNMVRKGVSGETQNQCFEFNMSINNPALTAQILVGAARASIKQQPGSYTMIEIPVIDLCYGEKEKLIRKLV